MAINYSSVSGAKPLASAIYKNKVVHPLTRSYPALCIPCSKKAVKDVQSQGRVCVLDIDMQVHTLGHAVYVAEKFLVD